MESKIHFLAKRIKEVIDYNQTINSPANLWALEAQLDLDDPGNLFLHQDLSAQRDQDIPDLPRHQVHQQGLVVHSDRICSLELLDLFSK